MHSLNSLILDEWSDYGIASHADSAIVAFEKSGLWPDKTVSVCFRNLRVERMSISDFEALINKVGE